MNGARKNFPLAGTGESRRKRDMTRPRRTLTERGKKIAGIAAIGIFILFSGLVAWFIGKPMVQFVSEPDRFRAWVESKGALGQILFVGMMALQILVALIPGEPLEIGAGYAFGAVEGTILCVLGILIGSALVFGLVRKFGVRLVEVFFSKEKIQSLRFLQNPKKLNFLAFVVFFIPGTPKDLLSYFVGLTPMKFSTWILITGIARLPSVITSTVAGDALGLKNYQFALIVFGATLAVSGLGLWIYRRISRAHEQRRAR